MQKVKRKIYKYKDMFKCSLINSLRAAVFFPTAPLLASIRIALLWPQQPSMKLTISLLLKDTIDLLFFLEHKLYGFSQSGFTQHPEHVMNK